MNRLTKIVALLLAVFVVVPVLAAEKKKAAKKPSVPNQFRLPPEITLNAEQQKKLDELMATYGPKLQAIEKQRAAIFTEEQRKAGSEARKNAEAAGKPSKEVTQAADDAMKLTPEQKTKLDAIRKETSPISKEIRGKILDILTPEQKVQFEKAEQKKREGATKLTGNAREVRLEKRSPLRVAFVRNVGPYQECGPTWEKLLKFATEHGLVSSKTLRIGVCYGDPEITPPEQLRYDACLTVNDQFQATGEVGVQELPGGQYAVLTLRGPYSGLAGAYRWFFNEWLPTSGRELRTTPCLEVYVTDPKTTPQEEAVTEIYLPLAN
jgi:DNA gyrase inhibitor GyrI